MSPLTAGALDGNRPAGWVGLKKKKVLEGSERGKGMDKGKAARKTGEDGC